MNTYKRNIQKYEITNQIDEMPVGRVFAFRDLIPHPQALWGRFFNQEVRNGIYNVIPLNKKDSMNASLYMRV